MMHLNGDTTISRTSSGFAIDEKLSPELNAEAVLKLVERIVTYRGFVTEILQAGLDSSRICSIYPRQFEGPTVPLRQMGSAWSSFAPVFRLRGNGDPP